MSEPDGGQSDAINKGFARCRGEIRAYLNSDDVLRPGAVARPSSCFAGTRNGTCSTASDHIDVDDAIIGPYPTREYAFAGLLQNCFICQPAAFWRARVADAIGPFDAGLHYALDLDYWLRIARAGGRIAHVPTYSAASRVYPETKTLAGREKMYREILAVCRRHAGGAGFSQYFAYWHHRCHERATAGRGGSGAPAGRNTGSRSCTTAGIVPAPFSRDAQRRTRARCRAISFCDVVDARAGVTSSLRFASRLNGLPPRHQARLERVAPGRRARGSTRTA